MSAFDPKRTLEDVPSMRGQRDFGSVRGSLPSPVHIPAKLMRGCNSVLKKRQRTLDSPCI